MNTEKTMTQRLLDGEQLYVSNADAQVNVSGWYHYISTVRPDLHFHRRKTGVGFTVWVDDEPSGYRPRRRNEVTAQ